MSSPDHEISVWKPSCVCRLPAGSPSISSVYSLMPVREPLAGGFLAHQPLDVNAEPVRARRHLARRAHDLVAAADIEIVHQQAILDVEAVARRRVAMRDQHALGAAVDLDMRLDGVAAAAHIGRDVGRHMAHAGMEGELMARAVEARGVLGKARPEAIVERQHVVLLGLAPPQLDHLGEPLRLLFGEIIGLGEIAVEMEQLPFVVLERRAGRMEGDRLPAAVPEAAMAEHLEILRRDFRRRRRVRDRARKALALERHLRTPAIARGALMPMSSSSVGTRSQACTN